MTGPTALMRRLDMRNPIIQAPLAGGGDTPALVAAVSEAGGFGFVGAAYLRPRQIGEAGRAVRALTRRPFGINLFAPQPAVDMPSDPRPALDGVARYFAELDLPPPLAPALPKDGFGEQLAAALDTEASAISFTLGLLPAEAIAAVKARGRILIGTATTVGEAVALERAGVDAVVAQGGEAGGHRGTFAETAGPGLIGTVALVPQVVDAVRVPVIASGGIMDGRGIAAARALGAQAVQLGTVFLTSDEAGIPEVYKATILAAGADDTRVTRAFSGRPARGIVNQFMTAIDAAGAATILPFPLQNALTRPLRTAAGKAGRAEFLSLWAGQGLGLARREPAGALVARLVVETDATISRLTAG